MTRPPPPFIAGAGVVTRRVSEAAERDGFVFAVDPTSADACCIGGNIAMNAGGKKAVLWGTARRQSGVVAHGRCRRATGSKSRGWIIIWARSTMRPSRASICAWKDGTQAADQARYCAASGSTSTARSFARSGLGKDVTDKFLGGLPGVQKEGCDGMITAARCILHRMPNHTRTVCLEFFGQAREAIPSILEIGATSKRAPGRGTLLAGLEHLDERYLRAVGYSTKSKRGALPKMVLLGDIVGEDADAVAAATSRCGAFGQRAAPAKDSSR